MKLFARPPAGPLWLLPVLALALILWQVPLLGLAQRQIGLRLFLQEVFAGGTPAKRDGAAAAAEYLRQAGRRLDTTRLLGVVNLEAGREREAEAYFLARLALRPDDILTHFFLGELYRRRGQTAAAVTQWERAGAGPTLVELGRSLLGPEPEPDGMAALEAAMRLDPYNIEARRLAGDALLKQGQIEAALALYQGITAIAPENPLGYELLGRLLFNQKYYREAIPFLRQALQHSSPPSPWLLVTLGQAEAALGHWPEAADAYQRALDFDPTRQGSYILLAEAQCRLGRPAEALAAYEAALTLGALPGRAEQAGDYLRLHHTCPPDP